MHNAKLVHPFDSLEELQARFSPFFNLGQALWDAAETAESAHKAGVDLPAGYEFKMDVSFARALIALGDELDAAVTATRKWTDARKAAEADQIGAEV